MQMGLEAYVPKQHAARVKRLLIENWNNQCAYCGYTQKNKEMTLDHVIPITKQGTDEYFNLVPACRPCNLSKGHQAIRQWYFDSEHYTEERWIKIKLHMTRIETDVLAA